MNAKLGKLYGVGVGPGDPSLLTLKTHRLIIHSPVIAYLCNAEGHSMARNIASESIAQGVVNNQIEIPITMPMNTDRTLANQAYDTVCEEIIEQLSLGKDVVFLCEGDPLFFGSFIYIFDRFMNQNDLSAYSIEVVPGITSINTASALLGRPLGVLAENIAIISGRLSDQKILDALQSFDNIAIMKAGSQRMRLLELIEQAGRMDDGCYIEYASLAQQKIVHNLNELPKENGPYFSLLLLNRHRNIRMTDEVIK